MQRGVLEDMECDPASPAERRHPVFHRAAVGIRVPVGVQRTRLRLVDQALQFSDRITLPEDERTTSCADVRLQRLQTATQERLPRRTRPSVTAVPAAGNVNWDHRRRIAGSVVQSGVVAQPEIPAEPVNSGADGRHVMSLRLPQGDWHPETTAPVRRSQAARD